MTGVYALIPAAGRGVRFGSAENKVFAPLLGRPLLGWTLQTFAQNQYVTGIIVVGNETDLPRLKQIGEQYGNGKVTVVLGGGTRQESVRRGLEVIPASANLVIVHDAARPCLTDVHISAPLVWLRNCEAVAWAVPVNDTLVRAESPVGTNARMGKYISRDGVWAMQTPQVFRRVDLVRAHEQAAMDGFTGTDDAGLVRRLGVAIQLMPGTSENIKITRPEDLDLARTILTCRQNAVVEEEIIPIAPTEPEADQKTAPPSGGGFRIGHGYDVHPFAEDRPMWLGGVHFPESPKGLQGHSDADALLHAVCDALLGAAGLGDIGKLFPPSDPRHKDRASIEFLDEVKLRLDEAGWRIANIDITVIAEYPKIGPKAEAIKQKIAVCLGVDVAQISVKATTNEQMGFVGRGEGIAVHATALLFR